MKKSRNPSVPCSTSTSKSVDGRRRQPRLDMLRAAVERLESRTLMSVSSTLSNGTLMVNLTQTHDHASITVTGPNIIVSDTTNPATTPVTVYRAATVNALSVQGSGDADEPVQLISSGQYFKLPGGLATQGVSDATLTGFFAATALDVDATVSVTVSPNAVISTRLVAAGADPRLGASTANADSLRLGAPTITVDDNAQLLANGTNGFTGGAITLDAEQGYMDTSAGAFAADTFESRQAVTQVTIGSATITGASVDIISNATTAKLANIDVDQGALQRQITASLATMIGSPTLVFTPATNTAAATISRDTGSWVSDRFVAGDTIAVTLTGFNDGLYSVASVSPTVLTLVSNDQVTGQLVSTTNDSSPYAVNETTALMSGAPALTFNAATSQPATITRATGSWSTDGFAAGQLINITGTTADDGQYTIQSVINPVPASGNIPAVLGALVLSADDAPPAATVAAGSSVQISEVYTKLDPTNLPVSSGGVDDGSAGTPSGVIAAKYNEVLGAVQTVLNIPLSVAAIVSHATGNIAINNGAVITAPGSVTIASTATSNVSAGVPSLIAGVVYADSEAVATAAVNPGVHITAGGDFNLTATVSNTISASVSSETGTIINGGAALSVLPAKFTYEIPGPAFAVSYGHGVSTSTATLAAGSFVNAANATVNATNTNNFDVSSSSKVLFPKTNQGDAASVTVSDNTSIADATVGGSISATGNAAVTAQSDNLTDSAETFASVSNSPPLSNTVAQKVDSNLMAKLAAAQSPGGSFGLSAAVVVAQGDNEAHALIAPGGFVGAGGNVNVSGEASDAFADTAIGSNSAGAEVTIGGAVSVPVYTNIATADIGQGATVEAVKAVNVTANAVVPLRFNPIADVLDDITLLRNFALTFPPYDGNNSSDPSVTFKNAFGPAASEAEAQFKSLYTAIVPFVSAALGNSGSGINSYVGAASTAGNKKNGTPGTAAVSGTAAIQSVTNVATAAIDGGALVDTLASLPGLAGVGQTVAVTATTSVETINVGGFPGATSLPFPTSSIGNEAGGTYSQATYNDTANAHIDAGAVVTPGDSVTVHSDTHNLNVTFDLSGGKGDGFSLDGVFTLQTFNNTSLAYISGDAFVVAGGGVTVTATNEIDGIALSLAAVSASEVGVGVSIGINHLNDNVQAYIGNATTGAAPSTGVVAAGINFNASTNGVTVSSSSTERNIAVAVAGVVNSTPTPSPSPATPPDANSLPQLAESEGADAIDGDDADDDESTEKTAGLGLSGASSVNLLDDTTEAFINDGAIVSATGDVGVGATNTAQMVTVSGAAAIDLTGSAESDALAGALSYDPLNRTVEGFIQDATINSGGQVTTSAVTYDGTISITLGAGGSPTLSGGVGIAGSVNLNTFTGHTESGMWGNSNVSAATAVTNTAHDTYNAVSVAGAIGASGETGVGAGFDVAVLNNTVLSYAGPGTITAGGAVQFLANTDRDIVSVGASVAVGLESLGISGAVSSYTITDDDEAYVMPDATVSGESIGLFATDGTDLVGVGGSGALGGTAIGASLANANFNNTTLAYIGAGAHVSAAGAHGGGVGLTATDAPQVSLIGAGGQVSTDDAALGLSAVVDTMTTDTEARIDPGAVVIAGGDTHAGGVQLSSTDAPDILDIAGAFNGGETAGIGAGADVETVSRTVIADIGNGANVSSGSNVLVTSSAPETFLNIGASLAAAGDAAVSGAVVVLVLNVTAEAFIDDDARVSSQGSVAVQATRTSTWTPATGGIAAAGEAGVGAQVTTLVTTDHTLAYIGQNAIVDAQAGGQFLSVPSTFVNTGAPTSLVAPIVQKTGIIVTATSTENLTSLAVGGAAGIGGGSVAGSVVVSILNDTTKAYTSNGSKLNTTIPAGYAGPNQSVYVVAYDRTSVTDGAGAASLGGGVGLGAGVDVPIITKDTEATLGIGSTTDANSNVQVLALNTETVLSAAASIGLGIEAAGIAGTASVYSLNDHTLATISSQAIANATDNVQVSAFDFDKYLQFDGALSIGSVAGVGGAVGVSIVSKDTAATIGSSSNVTALGNDTGLTADTGIFNIALANRASGDPLDGPAIPQSGDLTTALSETRTATPATTTIHGLIVTAISTSDIEQGEANAGGGAALGVQLNAAADVPTIITTATIGGGALINHGDAGSSPAQSVVVTAGTDYYHVGLAGTVSVAGGLGIAAGVAVDLASLTTTAIIGIGAGVFANSDIVVNARTTGTVYAIGVGIAGAGGAAIAATPIILRLTDVTLASIDSSANVIAGGDLVLSAEDTTTTRSVSGSAGIAGILGGGAAVGVTLVTKDTEATVGPDTIINSGPDISLPSTTLYTGNSTAPRGVDVEATSYEDLETIAAAGGFALGAGLAGSVSVQVANVTTIAQIEDYADVNLLGNPATAAGQYVLVTAYDNAAVKAIDGSLGVGLFVGASGAVDVGILHNNTKAIIDSNADVTAKSVNVTADTIRNVSSTVVDGSAGAIALAAAVSVYSLGGALDAASQSATTVDGTSVGGYADSNSSASGISGAVGTIASKFLGSAATSTNITAIDAPANAAQNQAGTGTSGDSGSLVSASNNGSTAGGMTTSDPAADGTDAYIGAGAVINSAAGVAVFADENSTVTQTVGQGSGGLVSLGGSVAITNAFDAVAAHVDSNVQINPAGAAATSGVLDLKATQEDTLTGQSYAGSIGLATLGAQVVELNDGGTQSAYLGDNVQAPLIGAGGVTVFAQSVRSLNAGAVGGSIGGLVVGAVIATANVGGGTSAMMGANDLLGSAGTSVIGQVELSANSNDTAVTTGQVDAAGILAGTLNDVASTVTPIVAATIGIGTIIHGALNISVLASAYDTATSTGKGLQIGGAIAGGTVASATVSPNIQTTTGSGTQLLAGGNVTVQAELNGDFATASGTASAGALVGAIGVSSTAVSDPVMEASIGSGNVLQAGGDVTVATVMNYQSSNTSATAFGENYGAVSVGESDAEADDTPSMSVLVGTAAQISASGNVLILAATDTYPSGGGSPAIFGYANASLGALIGFGSTKVNTTDTAFILVVVGGQSSISAGESVTVRGVAHLAPVMDAITTVDGLYSEGSSTVTGTLGNTVTVDTLSSVSLLAPNGDVNVLAYSDQDDNNWQAISEHSGAVTQSSTAGTTLAMTVNDSDVVSIGSNNIIEAADDVTIDSQAAGLITPVTQDNTNNSADALTNLATSNVNITAPTSLTVGQGTIVSAPDAVSIVAGANNYDVVINTSINSSSVFTNDAVTTGNARLTANSTLNVLGNVQIEGDQSVQLQAYQPNVALNQLLYSDNGGYFDPGHLLGGVGLVLGANVTVAQGSSVVTTNLNVTADTPSSPTQFVNIGHLDTSNKTDNTGGRSTSTVPTQQLSYLSYGKAQSQTATTTLYQATGDYSTQSIDFEGAITLLRGPDPVLTVDASGNVTKAVGLTYYRTGSGITVNPLINTVVPTIVFYTPNNGTLAGGTDVTVNTGWRSVTIDDSSGEGVNIDGIAIPPQPSQTFTVNVSGFGNVTLPVLATVTYTVGSAQSYTGPVTFSAPATAVALNAGGQFVYLSGLIDNPAGSVSINSLGTLYSAADASINAHSIDLVSLGGSVGLNAAGNTPAQPVHVELTSGYSATDLTSGSLTGSSNGDFVVEITALTNYAENRDPTGSPTVHDVAAGGNILLIFDEGKQDFASRGILPPTLPGNLFEELIDGQNEALTANGSSFTAPPQGYAFVTTAVPAQIYFYQHLSGKTITFDVNGSVPVPIALTPNKSVTVVKGTTKGRLPVGTIAQSAIGFVIPMENELFVGAASNTSAGMFAQ